MQKECSNVYINTAVKSREKRPLGYITDGKKISYILIQQSMKKETTSKLNAQNTYTTMKEVLRDPRYIQAVEIMSKHEREWNIQFPSTFKDEE